MSSFVKRCPECNSINLGNDEKKGEIVCRSCGFVLDDNHVDTEAEYRNFEDSDTDRRRTGSPVSFTKADMGTSTQVGSKSDVYNLPVGQRRKVLRMQQWQQRSSTSLERNLKYALVELKRVSSLLNIPPSIEEEAARIYNLAVRQSLVRGRSMDSVVVGAVYISSRRFNLPRSLNEICKVTGSNKRDVGKTYRYIARSLGIKLLPSGPGDYVPKFANKLGFSSVTQTKAVELLKKAQNLELTSGRGPIGLAAAALYVASLIAGEKRTQREIADAVGITEVTIRNRYKEIIDKLNLTKTVERLERQAEIAKGR